MPAQDAFYALPDSLVALILSKIPLRDAVRCCILSRRWRFLYTHMPRLSFSLESVLGSDFVEAHNWDEQCMSRVENIISDMLLLHSRNLEGLDLYNTWETQHFHFSREKVCKWIRYASLSNVKHLSLHEDGISGEIQPPALFSCSRLITLVLKGYDLTIFPIDFVGFPNLTSCFLWDVQLSEKSLVSLISLCPFLQKLDITAENRLGNVTVTSSTIEYLKMDQVKSLSLDCPKLKTFDGYEIEDLTVNGVRFYEFSKAVSFFGLQCASTLTELYLVFDSDSFELISASRFYHIVSNFQSLKVLDIHMPEPFEEEEEKDVPLLNLLYKLPNLQSLSMSGFFLKELAIDPMSDCLASPLVNLKKIYFHPFHFGYEKDEIAVISCLLQSTPCLEIMKISLPDKANKETYKNQYKYCKDVLYLRRASSRARIIVY